MDGTPEPRRARHLMDPNQPRKPTTPEDLARLQRVQRWVLSVLAVTTVLHLSLGLVLSALFLTGLQPRRARTTSSTRRSRTSPRTHRTTV